MLSRKTGDRSGCMDERSVVFKDLSNQLKVMKWTLCGKTLTICATESEIEINAGTFV